MKKVLLTKGEGTYTNKIDNWSLGVILYICLVGYPPFSEDDKTRTLERQIVEGRYDFPQQFWSDVSKDAIDLIKRLMCVDPRKRATLEEVLEHRWIKNDKNMQEKAHRLMYTGRQNGVMIKKILHQEENGNEENRTKRLRTSPNNHSNLSNTTSMD